jgi:hypothetical protein
MTSPLWWRIREGASPVPRCPSTVVPESVKRSLLELFYHLLDLFVAFPFKTGEKIGFRVQRLPLNSQFAAMGSSGFRTDFTAFNGTISSQAFRFFCALCILCVTMPLPLLRRNDGIASLRYQFAMTKTPVTVRSVGLDEDEDLSAVALCEGGSNYEGLTGITALAVHRLRPLPR